MVGTNKNIMLCLCIYSNNNNNNNIKRLAWLQNQIKVPSRNTVTLVHAVNKKSVQVNIRAWNEFVVSADCCYEVLYHYCILTWHCLCGNVARTFRFSQIGGSDCYNFMFCWPCISIYGCNGTNLMYYLSSVYSVTIPLHVAGLLVPF
jgi:hypothetical protein